MYDLLLFATSNDHKYKEAKSFFQSINVNIEHLRIQYTEIQNDSLEIISKYSVIEVSNAYSGTIFVEDSGLFLETLNGFPGPYSSYVNSTIGPEGIINLLNGSKNRSAYFLSVIALAQNGKLTATFKGKVKGSISEELRGYNGFAFDVCFIPDEFQSTFAEMTLIEKNQISHRRKSMEKLAQHLNHK